MTLDNALVNGTLQGYVTDETRKWEAIETIQPSGNEYVLTLPIRSVVSYVGSIQ